MNLAGRTLALLAAALLTTCGLLSPAHAGAGLMCDQVLRGRTLLVQVDRNLERAGVTAEDVDAALDAWNEASGAQSGRAVFHYAAPGQPVDVVITAQGTPFTYVNTPCNPGPFAPITVNLGLQDGFRNAYWLLHELGHALGFADVVRPTTDTTNYINARVCDGTYEGVMSYCTPRELWLQTADDAQLLWDWWFS